MNLGSLNTADEEFNQIIHLSLSTFIFRYVLPYRQKSVRANENLPETTEENKNKKSSIYTFMGKGRLYGLSTSTSYMNVAPAAGAATATYYNSPLYNKLFNYLKRKRTFYIEKNA